MTRSQAARLLAGAVLGAVALSGASARAAGIITQFQGATLAQSGFVPPDMGGGVGDGYVVQLLNGVATIDTTAGVQVSQNAIGTFFNSSSQISDPRIIYDPASQRWFASAITVNGGLGSQNSILLAVSAGANPTGGFTTLSFASAGTTTFADFPTLGVNNAAVTIGTNDFSTASGNAYLGSSLYSIPKSSLTAATATLTGQSNFINTTQTGAAPQAVTSAGGGGSSTAVLSVGSSGANQVYALSTVTGANATGATLALTNIYNQPFNNALIAPTQPGGSSYDPGDNRISSGPYQAGNNIYFANTVSTGTQDQIAWNVLSASSGSLSSGLISITGLNLTYGSIAGNANGTFVVSFNGSGAGQNITDYYVICSAATSICGIPQIAYTSLASNYVNAPGGTNRWGDYSWTTLDPTNQNDFWLFQEYALSNSSWGTVTTEIGTAVPEPAGVALLGLGAVALGMIRRRAA